MLAPIVDHMVFDGDGRHRLPARVLRPRRHRARIPSEHAARRLHARPPRERAALAPVAHGGELGRLPARRARPRHSRARRRLRSGHDHHRHRRAGRAGHGRRHRPRARGARRRARGGARRGRRQCDLRRGRRVRARVPRRRRTTSCTRTRCCSTSPIRSPRWWRCGGCARPAAWWPRATPTTRRSRGSPTTRASTRWLALYHEVARRNDAEPDAGRHLLQWARAAGFSTVDADRVGLVLRDPTPTGRGGAGCGRTASSRRRSPSKRSTGVWRRRPSSTTSPPPGGRGAQYPDAWFGILHGEIRAVRRERRPVVAVDGGEGLDRIAPQPGGPGPGRVPERDDRPRPPAAPAHRAAPSAPVPGGWPWW